jgi:hypothetical protein
VNDNTVHQMQMQQLRGSQIASGPYWHADNPWADKVVYVPLERLAAAIEGGTIGIGATGKTVPYDVAFILQHWAHYGDKLDAYILPQPQPSRHSVGVRYGQFGSEYLSPHNANPERVQALLEEFRK